MRVGRVEAVHTGRIAPLGADATPSGFAKQAQAGGIAIDVLGLSGDEQADLSVHGGPDKAVYAYPIEHYADWLVAFPANSRTLVAGGMGENLVTSGLDENDVRIGDIHRIGSAILQVTQPRQPCYKLGLYHGAPKMVRLMTKTGRCGWYLRVIQSGEIAPGEPIGVVETAAHDWTVRKFAVVTAGKQVGREILTEISALPGLAEVWRLGILQALHG